MFAQFEYRLSKDEYVNGLRVGGLAAAAQDSRRIWWCIAYLALVGSGIAVAATLNPGSLDGIIAAIIILFIGSCLIQARLARNWREASFESENAVLNLAFDADGITERRKQAETRWSWEAVRQVCDLPEAVVLQMVGWHMITIPSRLWCEASERSEFVTQVRERATNLLPELKSFALRGHTGSMLLTFGAVAIGLDLIIFRDWLLYLAGVDLCSCAVHRSLAGQAAQIVTFVAAITAIVLTKVGLERLRKIRPRLAAAVAVLFISLFSAVLLWGLAARLQWVLNPPTR